MAISLKTIIILIIITIIASIRILKKVKLLYCYKYTRFYFSKTFSNRILKEKKEKLNSS